MQTLTSRVLSFIVVSLEEEVWPRIVVVFGKGSLEYYLRKCCIFFKNILNGLFITTWIKGFPSIRFVLIWSGAQF